MAMLVKPTSTTSANSVTIIMVHLVVSPYWGSSGVLCEG
jgi:hypothetical protein